MKPVTMTLRTANYWIHTWFLSLSSKPMDPALTNFNLHKNLLKSQCPFLEIRKPGDESLSNLFEVCSKVNVKAGILPRRV